MAEEITSRENPSVKLFCRVIASAKARREEGLFALEGLRLCREAVLAGIEIPLLFLTPKAKSRWREELEPLEAYARQVLLVEEGLAGRIADTKNPQGIFCLCALPEEHPFVLEPHGRYILLDGLQDPGNLGTILRGAEAFGMTAAVLAGCPDPYAPKVLRSAMGSAFRLVICQVKALSPLLEQMNKVGIFTCAAALGSQAILPQKLPLKGGIALVIGNEGKGVSPQVLNVCQRQVYIPMASPVESLNAAAAATVLMWEIARQE